MGDKLKYTYGKSKIGLNIHIYQGRPIFEITRIILLIANKVLVMTEPSYDLWYDEHYADLVYYFKTTNYYTEYLEYLQNYNYNII